MFSAFQGNAYQGNAYQIVRNVVARKSGGSTISSEGSRKSSRDYEAYHARFKAQPIGRIESKLENKEAAIRKLELQRLEDLADQRMQSRLLGLMRDAEQLSQQIREYQEWQHFLRQEEDEFIFLTSLPFGAY